MLYIVKVKYFESYDETDHTSTVLLSADSVCEATDKALDLYCTRSDGIIDESVLEALTAIPVGEDGYLELTEGRFDELAKEWAGI